MDKSDCHAWRRPATTQASSYRRYGACRPCRLRRAVATSMRAQSCCDIPRRARVEHDGEWIEHEQQCALLHRNALRDVRVALVQALLAVARHAQAVDRRIPVTVQPCVTRVMVDGSVDRPIRESCQNGLHACQERHLEPRQTIRDMEHTSPLEFDAYWITTCPALIHPRKRSSRIAYRMLAGPEKEKAPQVRELAGLCHRFWRRRRDSNPRSRFWPRCSLSRGVPSTSRPRLPNFRSHQGGSATRTK